MIDILCNLKNSHLKYEYYLTDPDDVGARMSAVFLAKVEIKEKEGNEKYKTIDNGEDKVIKRMVSYPGYYFQVDEINRLFQNFW